MEEAFELLEKEFNKSTEDTKICRTCHQGKIRVDVPSASALCSICGTQDNNYLAIDMSPEWKMGETNVVNRCNVIVDSFFPKTSLAINIGGNASARLKRCQLWANYNNSYRETSLRKTFELLNEYCSKSLPEANQAVKDYAKFLLARVFSDRKKLEKYGISLRGKANKVGLIALCLFYGFKKKGFSRFEENELAKRFRVEHKYLNLPKPIVLEVIQAEELDAQKVIEPMDIEAYSIDFLKKIGFKPDNEYFKQVINTIKRIEKYQFEINSVPSSIASGCLYYVSQKYGLHTDILTKREIARRIELSEVTITKCYKWCLILEKANKI